MSQLSWSNFFRRDRILRIIADVIMVNLSLIIALAVRYVVLVGIETSTLSPQEVLNLYLQFYLEIAWLLNLVSVTVFSLSGFYTHGRAYKGRYKALIIFQAVTLSYLIVSAIAYFTFSGSGSQFALPRGVTLIAWAITLAMMLTSRLWSTLWKAMVKAEMRLGASYREREAVKSVLVIGGAGYIGSALLPKLLERKYQVRLLDLLLYGEEPIADYLEHPNLEVIQADFRQIDTVVQAMQGIDAVVHLGAIVGDPACALDEELTIEVNLMATKMVAEVAKGSGVRRFIFASTCSVYGASNEMLDERSQFNPVSLYARSKIASEAVLRKMASPEFSPTSLRFGTIYGLSGRTRFDLVINLLTAKAIVDGKITVFGGDQWRPFVHVDDAALSVFKVLEAPLDVVHNEAFNVGSNAQNHTILEVAQMIHDHIPTAEMVSMGADTDRRNYRVDFSKIHNALGYEPQWTIDAGIRQVQEAIESGKVQNYRDAQYSNVRFLTEEGSSKLIHYRQDWAQELVNQPVANFPAR